MMCDMNSKKTEKTFRSKLLEKDAEPFHLLCWSIWYLAQHGWTPVCTYCQHCPRSLRSTLEVGELMNVTHFALHDSVRAQQHELLEVGKLVHVTCNLIVLLMLINLIHYMNYFITTLHLMAVSLPTKINFLNLGNLCIRHTRFNCASHADHFDTPHDPLHHYFAPHDSVLAHQDQLLELGELTNQTH